ncbi:hypothetical protein KZO01_17200 [Kurthia zopfii]|uniref:Abortive phage infection protein n=1 Tax=Kurthia zopfii TaxID=1650 RepID=A0A2U3ABX4_9BACL|nr:hypothetical protein [Kurthia zopfii]PWI22007.1 hypothetical protein DF281_09330 [Kurthia zopfii]TDR34939.1 hypothetical protein DFR61_13419 [Kurthia zopfii]STX08915.1 Uncharacterised protein [Kurthia zopfii]VEI04875.1 Uncharacterised protein [Kurthia zopfii]GEK31411.1 hypothetical protein KZO01_17200 [Kurthia zopfii]
MSEMNDLVEKLKNGEIKQIEVDKSNFYELREILVEREDFKYFRGIAKQGGKVVYEYLEEERS